MSAALTGSESSLLNLPPVHFAPRYRSDPNERHSSQNVNHSGTSSADETRMWHRDIDHKRRKAKLASPYHCGAHFTRLLKQLYKAREE